MERSEPDARGEVGALRESAILEVDGGGVAYQILGEGARTLFVVPGLLSHIDILWDEPRYASFFERLSETHRMVLFDKRGTGASDPVLEEVPPEQHVRDMSNVLRAADAVPADVFGVFDGAVLAVMLAATQPELVRSLLLYGAFLRGSPDALDGTASEDAWRRFHEDVGAGVREWGDGRIARLLAPSAIHSESDLDHWSSLERSCARRSSVRHLWAAIGALDGSAAASKIEHETLLLHRSNDPVPLEAGRLLHAAIAGSRFVELPGSDHLPFVGDSAPVVEEIDRFTEVAPNSARRERKLLAILVTDIVGSTRSAARLGDGEWARVLASHHSIVRGAVDAFGGWIARATGDGFVCAFPTTSAAICCGRVLVADVHRVGLSIRAGVHAGDCDVIDGDVSGDAVAAAVRAADSSPAGRVTLDARVTALIADGDFHFAVPEGHPADTPYRIVVGDPELGSDPD